MYVTKSPNFRIKNQRRQERHTNKEKTDEQDRARFGNQPNSAESNRIGKLDQNKMAARRDLESQAGATKDNVK